MTRLTPEQAAAIQRMIEAIEDGELLAWSDACSELEKAKNGDTPNEYSAAWLLTEHLLDLKVENASLRTRAEEAERDRDTLADVVRLAMSDAPRLIQLTPAQQGALDRAVGGAMVMQACPVCGDTHDADKEHNCGATDAAGVLSRSKGGA